MISVNQLEKAFGSLRVLKALTLSFSQGRIIGLAGPNACGKSTLIKSILGLVVPDSGAIYISGLLAEDIGAREKIGYMPQHADFPANFTPRELFRLVAELRRREPRRREELIERFGLKSFLDKKCSYLSVGTRQKISAVAAFMCDPEILILDEPTAGFDPIACATFKGLLMEESKRGSTILLVSHIMTELDQLVDDLVFLLDGEVLFSGPALELKEKFRSKDLESGIVALMNSDRTRSERTTA